MSDRLEALAPAMAEAGVDVLAVAPSDNLFYLLGFSPHPDERLCLLLVGPQASVFVVPALNAEQSAGHVSGIEFLSWADADGFEQALQDGLARVAAGGAGRVAADPLMRADHLLALQAHLPAPEYVNAELVLRGLREVKSPDELELLKASALTADRAMEAALAACRAGVSEADVGAAAAAGFGAAGADRVGFAIVGSGPNGALPHHHTGRRLLEEGDPVVIDIGGSRAGYQSDITRMAFVGEPSAEAAEVVAVVEAALQAGMAAAGPGVPAGEVDRAARDVIETAGYGQAFVHRTGHGLGVSVHEPPWIMAGSEQLLRQGMVFSIEPGIYLPGRFGVRLEEIVVATADGCERLSGLSREPRVVGA